VYTNAGAAYPGSPFTAGGIQDPTGNAIDAKGNVWFGNNNGTVTALTSTGAKIAGSPFATGNTNYSDGIAIDGLGDVWVTNSLGGAVYELSSAGAEISPTTGYTAKPATEADGLAIDGSGDVWYDSYNAAAIYELIGAAAPAKNPLSLAVQQSTLGTRP
jgi:DNA-binding beta-propeller fold protein YncE